jgi:hypothetical protein
MKMAKIIFWQAFNLVVRRVGVGRWSGRRRECPADCRMRP